MAFNPFHRFRKHQKVIFAILTIISMLSFIGIAGVSAGGDFFSELARLLVGRGRSTDVALLYGKRIDARDLIYLRRQRRLTNQFMAQAVLQAHNNIFYAIQKGVQETPPRYGPDQKERLQRILQGIIQGQQYAARLPQYFAPKFLQDLSEYQLELQEMENQLDRAKKPTEKAEIQKLREALYQEVWLFRAGEDNPKDPLYPQANLWFGGGLSLDALLDFMIWQHEADRLGIQLSADDIKKEFQRETLHLLKREDERAIERNLGLDRATGMDLVAALGEEFRVRLAQAALVGYDPGGFAQTPAPVTPYELWEYYRKNRTEVNAKLLPVPAGAFLAQVKETPSDEELRALFEQYKDVEPAPTRDEPGFKQPRRIKVGWIEASAGAGSYRRAAEAAAWVLQATLPLAWEAQLLREYEQEKSFQYRLPGWTEPSFASTFYGYISLNRPQDDAAVIGQVLAAAGTQAGPLPPAAGSYGTAVAQNRSRELEAAIAAEARSRIPFDLALFGAASTAPLAPLGFNPLVAFAAVWEQGARTERYLPLNVVKGQLIRKTEDSLAQELVKTSLAAFQKALEGRRSKQEQFVAEEVRKHGWKHGSSERWDDLYDIAQDPGLKELREADRPLDPKGKQFAGRFFYPMDQARKLYVSEQMPGPEGTFLYWKTADEPPRTLTFEEARSQVEAAWRLTRARELARAKADQMAKEAARPGSDPLPALTEAAKHLGQNLLAFDGVALLKRTPSPQPGLGPRYSPYQVPEDKIEYPSPDFARELLELKQVGDVKVVANEPHTIYYVAALTQRVEPSVREFQKDTAPSLFERQSFFLTRLEEERRTAYRRDTLKHLQEQAKLHIDSEARKQVDEPERGSMSED